MESWRKIHNDGVLNGEIIAGAPVKAQYWTGPLNQGFTGAVTRPGSGARRNFVRQFPPLDVARMLA